MKLIKITLFIIGIIVLYLLGNSYRINYRSDSSYYHTETNEVVEVLDESESEGESEINSNQKRILTDSLCIGEFCDGSGDYDNYLAQGNSFTLPVFTQGGDIGCGMKVIDLPYYTEPKTSGILNEAYKKLFTLQPYSDIVSDGIENPVGSYVYLHFKKVTINEGTARVYLEGSVIGPGHCSIPILRKQLTELAFQFESVKKVEVYLNGVVYDWCAMDPSDGEGSCPEIPQYWIDSR